MSVRDIPLRKALQLFYADEPLRRSILKEDIRLDRKKEAGGSRSRGGDFYLPFWTDVKAHVAGSGDLRELTALRIQSNRNYARLYPLLTEGVLDLLSARLRWSNEPIEIVAQSVHGPIKFDDLQAVVRVRDAFHARVRGHFNRIVYPYFSEEPPLPEEGGRLGVWAMQQALPEYESNDMRIIDVLRRVFFSPQISPLNGDEEAIFRRHYTQLIEEWERLKRD